MKSALASVLVVVAHPDDEVLGAGGAIARWVGEGVTVNVAFLADGVGSRESGFVNSAALEQRRAAAQQALEILGISTGVTFNDYPDNRLDTVPLLEIAQQIERLVEIYSPDTVVTHHAGDVNVDHQRVHQAVVTACRPQPGHPVHRLLFSEICSSTEWQTFGSAPSFTPNVFMDISNTLDLKRRALHAYALEMRDWPHSRSVTAVEYLAYWRGATVGCEAAEAFMLGREIL